MTLSLHKLLLSGAATALAALTLSPPALADAPGTDARCYDAANATTVGQADWKGCAGMYIVKDREQLKSIMPNGVTHEGINYTMEDSAHNVFTGQVTAMYSVFMYSIFNKDIGYWDTSNVTIFNEMFSYAGSFNQDISGWNTSKAIIMAGMFNKANSFNQDIGDWDTSNVKDISRMFLGATSFNQDIGDWDTSNVTIFDRMFYHAASFNQDIGDWNTSNVKDISRMFQGATSFNQDIGDWDTSNVTNFDYMFAAAGSFNQDISGWNTSNVKDYSGWNGNNTSSEPETFDANTPDAWTDDKKPVWGTTGRKPAAASVPARPARRAGGLHDVGEWDRAMKAGAPRSTMKAGWTYDMYMNAEPSDVELSDSELSATELSDSEPSAAEQFIVPGSVFPLAGEFSLVQGRKYPSPTGSFYLIFQDDGDVVVYTIDDQFVWGLSEVTDKYGSIAKVVQQADGNFAAYDKNDGWIWSARSVASPAGTKLHLGGFGALTLVSPDGATLWSSSQ